METTRVSARLRAKRINEHNPTAADKAYIEMEKKRQTQIEAEKKRQDEIMIENWVNNDPEIIFLRRHLENAIKVFREKQNTKHLKDFSTPIAENNTYIETTRVSARLRAKRIKAGTPTAADKAYMEAKYKNQPKIVAEQKRQAEIDVEQQINNDPEICLLKLELENKIKAHIIREKRMREDWKQGLFIDPFSYY